MESVSLIVARTCPEVIIPSRIPCMEVNADINASRVAGSYDALGGCNRARIWTRAPVIHGVEADDYLGYSLSDEVGDEGCYLWTGYTTVVDEFCRYNGHGCTLIKLCRRNCIKCYILWVVEVAAEFILFVMDVELQHQRHISVVPYHGCITHDRHDEHTA